eukprot:6058163-Amphidinium_carterae.2
MEAVKYCFEDEIEETIVALMKSASPDTSHHVVPSSLARKGRLGWMCAGHVRTQLRFEPLLHLHKACTLKVTWVDGVGKRSPYARSLRPLGWKTMTGLQRAF